ncbi:hypothetical protein HC256_003336 [Beauveria bassiana]|nr:hypothetical protein HC256_003336 [Beauveria bassiana]
MPQHTLSPEPPVSNMVAANDDGKAYHWALTDTERAHIVDLLNLDGNPISRSTLACNALPG